MSDRTFWISLALSVALIAACIAWVLLPWGTLGE